MVGSIVPTSTWAHNCGMHVIADHMIGILQGENFAECFKHKVYDKLLSQFQTIYQQPGLTWEKIRTASLNVAPFDNQIIWGYVLRNMISDIFESNIEYKNELSNGFLAALNLYKTGNLKELHETYPAIAEGCIAYFKTQELNIDESNEQDLAYWHTEGYKAYYQALNSASEKREGYIWLSKEELAVVYEYFNFAYEFIAEPERAALLDPKIIYFTNQSQTHWERVNGSNNINRTENANNNSEFNDFLLNTDILGFTKEAKNIGLLFFSEEKHLNKRPVTDLMAIVIIATKYNLTNTVKTILELPHFNQSGMLYDTLNYFKPAYFNPLNQFDENGIPALYYAICNQNIELVTRLLDKGACISYDLAEKQLEIFNIKVKGNGWFFAEKLNGIGIALKQNNLELLITLVNLIDAKTLCSVKTDSGETLFHILAKHQKISAISNLSHISYGLNSVNQYSQNCLHIAAEMGSLEEVKFCIENKVNSTALDIKGNTALHYAVLAGNLEIVEQIFHAMERYPKTIGSHHDTVSPNRANKLNYTPLQIAHEDADESIVQFFKTKGIVDPFYEYVSDFKKELNNPKPEFQQLIAKHIKAINAVDVNKHGVLHYACLAIKNELIKEFIQELAKVKANLSIPNQSGIMPLHIAAGTNNTNALTALLEEGVYVDFVTNAGISACHIAVNRNNREAFDILFNKGASVTLEAFPKALEELQLLNWQASTPITAAQIAARQPDSAIYQFLKEKNLIPTEQILYQSNALWLLNKIEDKLAIQSQYFSRALSDTYTLEQTQTYQFCTIAKVVYGSLGQLPLGFTKFGFEIAKQGLMHGYPILIGKKEHLYYYLKPTFHNYVPANVSKGFDYVSAGASALVSSPFTLINALDLYDNTTRRAVGISAGVFLMQLAQKCFPESKETQALSLFVGKELGFGLVDAYHETSPQKKRIYELRKNEVNAELNHSYEIWTALIGKTAAEKLISKVSALHEWKHDFYQFIGNIEHKIEDNIDFYTNFKQFFNNASSSLNLNLQDSIQKNNAFQVIKNSMKGFTTARDTFLLEIEQIIDENVWPNSDYKNLVLSYLYKQKAALKSQAREELIIDLTAADQKKNAELYHDLENKISLFDKEIAELNNLSKSVYEQTAKGKLTLAWQEAYQQSFETEYKIYHLDTLKIIDTDAVIDLALKDLGDKSTLKEISAYLESYISSLGVELDAKALDLFKSELQLENLKPCFSEFCKKQINLHVENAKPTFSENHEKAKVSLKKIEGEFKALATPEEIRLMDKEALTDLKTERFEQIAENQKTYIHESALIKAEMSKYIEVSLEKGQAEMSHIEALADLAEIQVHAESETNRLNKTYEQMRIIYQNFDKNVNFDELYESISKDIKTGKENATVRKNVTQQMLFTLVNAGLIGFEEAKTKYKHVFYDALTHKPERLKALVTQVLTKARNEVLDNAKQVLSNADKQIETLEQKIENAKVKVNLALNEWTQKTSEAESLKEETILKLKPSSQGAFNSISDNIEKHFSNLGSLQNALNVQRTSESSFRHAKNNESELSLLILSKQAELKKLSEFKLTPQGIHELVNLAFDAGNEVNDINNYIINFFVQKGMGSYEQLCQQFWDTLCTAQKASSASTRKEHLRSRLEGQVNFIDNTYVLNRKESLIEDVKNLTISKEKTSQQTEGLKILHQQAANKVALARDSYVGSLSVSEKAEFEKRFNLNFSENVSVHHEQDILSLFALVGQPQFMLDNAHYDDFLSENGQSIYKVTFMMVQKLLDYKYSFIPRPNDADFQNEFNQLVNTVHTVKQAEAIKTAKLNIDKDIAEHVYEQSLISNQAVETVISQKLQSNILSTKPLFLINANDKQSSIQVIQDYITEQIHSISISEKGTHELKAIWSPEVPKHHGKMHRMTNNVKKVYHENRDMIVGAAAIAAAIAIVLIAPQVSQLAANLLSGIEVKFTVTGIAGGGAAVGTLASTNKSGSEQTVAQQVVPSRYRNEALAHQMAKKSQQRYEHEQRILSQKFEKANQASFERDLRNNQMAQNPNRVNLLGLPGQTNIVGSPQHMPGLVQSERAPNNGAPRSLFLPFGYQDTSKPPIISPLETSKVQGSEQGNMVNQWNNQVGKKPNSVPDVNPKQPLNFLPSFNKLMHAQTAPRMPEPKRVPKMPLTVPVSVPNRKRRVEQKPKTGPNLKPQSYLPSKTSMAKMAANDSSQLSKHFSKNEEALATLAFENKVKLTGSFLQACGGNDAVVANACINSVYHAMAKKNHYLLFPMATSGASAKVGEAINIAQRTDVLAFGLNHDAKIASEQLILGNQLIFKDLFPFIKTYQEEGFKGIQKLEPYLEDEYESSYKFLIDAFSLQEQLDQKADKLAHLMKLNRNDIRVVSQFYSEPANREMALDIVINLVNHEQLRVQKMYTNEFTKLLKDPMNITAGKLFGLTQRINGKEFSLSSVKDPSNIDQRIEDFFKPIFIEIINMHADPVKLDQFHKQMNRQVEKSILNASPYETSKEDSVTSWQKNENVRYSQKMRLWASNFANELTIPQVPKKQKRIGI